MVTKLYIRKLFTDPVFTYWQMRDWICNMREKLPQRFHHLGPREPCTCYRCYK